MLLNALAIVARATKNNKVGRAQNKTSPNKPAHARPKVLGILDTWWASGFRAAGAQRSTQVGHSARLASALLRRQATVRRHIVLRGHYRSPPSMAGFMEHPLILNINILANYVCFIDAAFAAMRF